jgi:hypothetical protein
VLNLKTAEAIGITFTEALLATIDGRSGAGNRRLGKR